MKAVKVYTDTNHDLSAWEEIDSIQLGSGLGYIENAAGTVLAPNLTVSDVDNANLTSAAVTISSGFLAGDVLGINLAMTGDLVNGTSIHSNYDADTGVLTLTGADTKAHYQQVLEAVKFSSTSDNPTAFGNDTGRTISWSVNDGALDSILQNRTISVIPVNDAPTIDAAALAAVDEDTANPAGQTVAQLFAGKFHDVDGSDDITGIAVIANNATPDQGVWQYNTPGSGNGWEDVGTATETAALAFSADTLLRFVPAPDFNGTPGGLTVYGLDDTFDEDDFTIGASGGGGGPRYTIDTTVHGGSTPISADSISLSTTINPVNDAPVIADDTAVSFSGGTINSNGAYTPQISNGGHIIELTDGNGSEAASWFAPAKVSIVGFTASFDYQATGNLGDLADGMAFILQNAGPNALGGDGSALGYGENGTAAITPSAAVEFNIYNGHPFLGTNFAINGDIGNYNPTGSVNFWSTGDEIHVDLVYIGSTLTETLTDLVTHATYSTSYDNIDLAQILGSGTAYVGFSAATGGGVSTQTVSNFSFKPAAGYTENQAPVAIDTALMLSDVDSANLTGATIAIENFQAGQDVLDFTAPGGSGITGNYDDDTGVLTLSGTASVADYQAALHSVTYSNTSENPSGEARTITFQVDDGAAQNHASNVATATVLVTPVNDAAVISGTKTGFVIEAGGVNNFLHGVPTATGLLTDTDVDNQQNAFQAVSAIPSDSGYGTFTMTTGGVWTYTLDNENAAVQALNANNHPVDTFTVHTVDGTAQQVRVTIFGANDAPHASNDSFTTPTEQAVEQANQSFKLTVGNVLDNDSDPNNGDHLSVVSVGGVSVSGFSVLSISSEFFKGPGEVARYDIRTSSGDAHLAVSGDGSVTLWSDSGEDPFRALGANQSATINVNYTASDGHFGGTDTASAAIQVNGTNDAPSINGGSTASVSIAENTTAVTTVVTTDPDGPSLTYSIDHTPGTDFALFGIDSSGALAFLSAPDFEAPNDVGGTYHDNAYVVVVRASDGTAFDTQTITVNVTNVNEAPVIHTPAGGIQYWASNTTGDVTPINHISFDDPDAGNTPVRVTFTMNDNGDELDATNLTGSGVSVISGDQSSQIVLQGTIANINAYLFGGNLLWNPDGANDGEFGVLTVRIDDNGASPGGNIVTTSVNISEINPSFLGTSTNDFSGVNFTNIDINAGSGNDTITTAWNHQPGDNGTTYDGSSGSDTINLVFTPDQLSEILANTAFQNDLRSYMSSPSGHELSLLGSSWNAEAQNFETAHIGIVTGFGTGVVSLDSFFTPLPQADTTPDSGNDLVIGTNGNNTNLGGSSGSDGNDVIVGLGGNDLLNGGSGNDLLLGGAGNDVLIGGTGNDVLSGSSGTDTFVFTETNFGRDHVLDFQAGEDVIEFDQATFHDFAAVLAGAHQDGGDVVISADDTNTVTLHNVALATLHASNFQFVSSGGGGGGGIL